MRISASSIESLIAATITRQISPNPHFFFFFFLLTGPPPSSPLFPYPPLSRFIPLPRMPVQGERASCPFAHEMKNRERLAPEGLQGGAPFVGVPATHGVLLPLSCGFA